jgi:hypothetical protein
MLGFNSIPTCLGLKGFVVPLLSSSFVVVVVVTFYPLKFLNCFTSLLRFKVILRINFVSFFLKG